MKTVILYCLLAIMAGKAMAQDSLSHKNGFSMGYAVAVAVGDFRSVAFEKAYPPMAKEGGMLNLSYTYQLKPEMFVGATVGWRHIAYDLDHFAPEDDEVVVRRKSTSWHTIVTTADLQFNHYLRDGFVYAKAVLGPSLNRTYTLNVGTNYGNIIHEPATALGLAYGANIGAHVKFQQYGLGLDSGILLTKASFKRTNPQGETLKFTQAMNSIQLGIFGSYFF